MVAHEGSKLSDDVRFIGTVNGYYILASREKTVEGQAQVIHCRAVSISAREAVLIAPVIGIDGEWLAARFDHLGLLKGQIARRTADGFAMTFATTDLERTKLAAQIGWLKKRSMHLASEQRALRRWRPRDPRSVILPPNNETVGCFLIDLSRSGVAVSADLVPETGAPIAMGTLVGHVARLFDSGFAVQFAEIQEANGLEERLGIHPRARKTVLLKLRDLVAAGNGGGRAPVLAAREHRIDE